MNKERSTFSIEESTTDTVGEKKIQFTQAGFPSSFSVEDFAESLADDRLREMLNGIRPLKLKGKTTLEIEEADSMPVEILVFKLYWIDRRAIRNVARELKISSSGIYGMMRRAEIPIRDKSTARKMLFEDPDRKEKMLAKIHSPESNLKRSQWLKKHPEFTKGKVVNMWEGRRKVAEILEHEIHEVLGTYPNITLIRLHYVEGYSVVQISENTGLEESRIRILMRKYKIRNLDLPTKVGGKKPLDIGNLISRFYNRDIELSPKQEYIIYRRYIEPEYSQLTLKEIGYELGVSREGVRQIEERAIIKLSSAAMAQGQKSKTKE